MTFDEQLQRSLGAVSDHLREEVTRALHAAGIEMTAHAADARDAAVQDGSARAREQAEATARVEVERLERQLQDITASSASLEKSRAADVAACGRLVDGVRALDAASSLSDILDALVDRASREAVRVGLLIARRGELRGWRFAGFGPDVDPARSVLVRREDDGIVGEALRTGVAISSDTPGPLAAPAFAALGLGEGGACVAVPLIVSGDVAAVLYADQDSGDASKWRLAALRWTDAVELLARHAARCLEAATAIKAVRVLTDPPEISESAAGRTRDDAPAASGSDDHWQASAPAAHEHALKTSS